MSCDVAAAAFLLFAAPQGQMATTPAAFVRIVDAPASVASEPLFADIVRRAGALKSTVDQYRSQGATPGIDQFRAQIGTLASLNMQGHEALKARGVDGDLKCILRGIAQDLPVRLADLDKAVDAKARDKALKELSYLLNDNVEVITAPPAPPV